MGTVDRRRASPLYELSGGVVNPRCLWLHVHKLGTKGSSSCHVALPPPMEKNGLVLSISSKAKDNLNTS